MKAVYFLAVRHLRKRYKTALSIVCAVTVSVAAMVTFLSLTNGYQQSLLDRILGVNSHIRIVLPYGSGMEEYREVEAELADLEGIRDVHPLIMTQAFVHAPGGIRSVYLWGLDRENPISEQALNEGEMIPGKGLAGELALVSGTQLTVTLPDGGELELEYTSSFDAGLREYNEQIVLVNINGLREAASHRSRTLMARVNLEDPFGAGEITDTLSERLPYQISSWKEAFQNILSAFRIERRLFTVVLALLLVTTGFGIFSTLNTFVLEKRRSMGILRAFGMTPIRIKAFFILQGLIMGLMGSVLGVGLGAALTLILSRHPIDLPGDMYHVAYLPVEFSLPQILLVVLAMIVISAAASVHPALQASRADPVEVLKNE